MRSLPSGVWPRRLLFWLANIGFALLVALPLAACGGSTSGGNSSSGSTSTGPVNLTFWSWVPGIDKSVALWNQTHPNIHVTVNNVGSGPAEYDKLFTAIKANNEPDLGQVEFQYLPTFEATGGLVDLSQYGAAAVKNDFVPSTPFRRIAAPWLCSIARISSRSTICRFPPPGRSMPLMPPNCMLPTPMSTSPTFHPKNPAGLLD